MELTKDQVNALNGIKTWMTDHKNNLCTLCGNAGTGKTTLIKLAVKEARLMGKQVLCCAPTHKAKGVLSDVVNTCSIIRIPVSTTASLLGKQKKHSYIGTRNFGKELSDKIEMMRLVWFLQQTIMRL
jgi:RecG-like helicase